MLEYIPLVTITAYMFCVYLHDLYEEIKSC